MIYLHRQPPTPWGTRLPAAILTRIYHLAIRYPSAIPLDSTRGNPLYPPLLQTSSHIRSRFLPTFFETNIFTLRRSSLCKRAENKKNPALMPMNHRVHIRNLLLSTYTGASECLNLVLGRPCRNTLQVLRASFIDRVRKPQQKQQQGCRFCDTSTFPPLLAVFPRLRGVTVNVAANRDSGLVWRAFCKAAVREKRLVRVVCTGVGEGVLMSEERRLGMKVMIVDGKLRRVWEIVKTLERDEVRRFVEYGWRSEGVREARRVSERVADGLLRLFWYYEVDSREADDGDESASIRAEAGSPMSDDEEEQNAPTPTGIESPRVRLLCWLGLSAHTEVGSPAIDGTDGHMMPVRTDSGTWRPAGNENDKRMESADTVSGSQAGNSIREQRISTGTKDPKRPLASRWNACHWSRDFLTPLNWALRVWLKREDGEQDHEYVKIVEGRGVKILLQQRR